MAESRWYLQIERQKMGPLSGADVRDLAARGRITPQTPISQDGKNWVVAAKVRGLTFPRGTPPPLPDRPADVVEATQAGSAAGRVFDETWVAAAASSLKPGIKRRKNNGSMAWLIGSTVVACTVGLGIVAIVAINSGNDQEKGSPRATSKATTTTSLGQSNGSPLPDAQRSVQLDPQWYGYGYYIGEIVRLRQNDRLVDVPRVSNPLNVLDGMLRSDGLRQRMTDSDYQSCAAGYEDGLNDVSPTYPLCTDPPIPVTDGTRSPRNGS